MIRAWAVLLFFLGGAVQASTLRINFEGLTEADENRLVTAPFGGFAVTVETNGYTFYASQNVNSGIGGSASNNLFIAAGLQPRMSFYQTSGDNFALFGFSTNCDFCVILGQTDSGSITTTTQDDLGQGMWLNLSRVDIFRDIGDTGTTLAIDNVLVDTATVVPVPAALWLFVSALAGLGWRTGKQTVY